METYIYTLKHPLTNEVRYVGKTINPKRRYYEHLYQYPKTHKGCWVRSLLNEGLKPIMDIIETCTKDNWEEREIYWITQYPNLTNSTSGGDGGYIVTDMLREKLRILNTGKNNPNYGKKASPELLKKLSDSHKDKPLTQEHKDKIRDSVMKSAKKTPCSIDGILYVSISEASRILLIGHRTIAKRLNSKNFPLYIRITQ